MAVAASAMHFRASGLSAAWRCHSQHVPMVALRHVARRTLMPRHQRQSLHIGCTARPRRKDVQLATRKVPCRSFSLLAVHFLGTVSLLINLPLQAQESDPTPFFEPLLRSFVLGLGSGALFEATHVSWKVCVFGCLICCVEGRFRHSSRLLSVYFAHVTCCQICSMLQLSSGENS